MQINAGHAAKHKRGTLNTAEKNSKNAEPAEDQTQKRTEKKGKSARVALSGMALGDMEIRGRIFTLEGPLQGLKGQVTSLWEVGQRPNALRG